MRIIGPQLTGLAGGTITILGAGTGFGVSCLARSGDVVVPMATEGGHMSFAPSDAEELAALELMWKHGGRVSVERILSGDGLERLYRTLEQLAGRTPADLTGRRAPAACAWMTRSKEPPRPASRQSRRWYFGHNRLAEPRTGC